MFPAAAEHDLFLVYNNYDRLTGGLADLTYTPVDSGWFFRILTMTP